MARHQTRRSITVSNATFARLKEFCEGADLAMSSLLETLIARALGDDAKLVPDPPRPAPMGPASARLAA